MHRRSFSLASAPHTAVSSIYSKPDAVSAKPLPTLIDVCDFGLLSIHTEQSFLNRVTGLINFVSESPLLPVSNQGVVYWLTKWYKQHSLNFVANNHLVWDMENPRKASKRYGTLVRSSKTGLNEMLTQHQAAVQAFIMSRINGREDGVAEAVEQ